MEILLSCTTTSSPPLPYMFFIPVMMLLTLVFLMMMMKTKGRAGDKIIRPPPGPNFISTIKIIFKIRLFGLPHIFLGRFSKVYGPIMLIHLGRLPTLVISSAETANEILKTHDLNFCTRPQLAGPKRITNNFIDVAVAPYGDYWKEMRKIYIHKIMSAKCVQSFSSLMEEEVSNIINSIISSSSTTTTTTDLNHLIIVDFHERLLSLSANIFFRVIFGTSHQGTKTMDGYRFEQVVSNVTETLGRLSMTDLVPYIGWIIDMLSGQHATLEKDYHSLYTFLEQFISEYLDPNKAQEHNKMNEAVIDTLFELEGKQVGGVTLTRKHVKTVLADIFGAGIDTTYVSIEWAMAELVKNPTTMKKVQDEVRNCVGKKGKVDESDLDQLQYLKMVVKETLRLHPPGPLLIPRECIKQCNIKGYDICPKTIVVVNAWAIGRDPDSWDNPDMFSPERFMDSTVDFMGQNFDFLPFGAGRRCCPGIYLATAIMELTLANLLYRFNWELPNGMKKEDLDMEEAGTLFLHKKSGLELVLHVYNP